jgi:hypothetical protein
VPTAPRAHRNAVTAADRHPKRTPLRRRTRLAEEERLPLIALERISQPRARPSDRYRSMIPSGFPSDRGSVCTLVDGPDGRAVERDQAPCAWARQEKDDCEGRPTVARSSRRAEWRAVGCCAPGRPGLIYQRAIRRIRRAIAAFRRGCATACATSTRFDPLTTVKLTLPGSCSSLRV